MGLTQKYQSGGIVDVTQGDDPSTVDRVSNFMDATGNEKLFHATDKFGLPLTTYWFEERPEKPMLTAAQTAYLAAQLDPTVMTGLVDVAGGYPSFPGPDVPPEEAFSGEPMPSFAENVREGNLGIAALQTLGLIPGIGMVTRGRRTARALMDISGSSRSLSQASDPLEEGISVLARHQREPRLTHLDEYTSSQLPARKLRKKPYEHPVKELRRAISNKRDLRRANRQFYGRYPLYPLEHRLKAFKSENAANDFISNHPNRAYWYKTDRDNIFQDMRDSLRGYGDGYGFSLNRANLKGLVRKFKNEGWSVDHVSKEQGRVSSYYMKKDDDMVRVSGHELPMTQQREYDRSRGLSGIWDGEIVVSPRTNIDSEYTEMLELLELNRPD